MDETVLHIGAAPIQYIVNLIKIIKKVKAGNMLFLLFPAFSLFKVNVLRPLLLHLRP